MSDVVAFIQWESYAGDTAGPGLFSAEATFNSRQQRLHEARTGDRVWLVSRHPGDRQYYFVAVLRVMETRRNTPGSPVAERFGEYSVVADPASSHDLATRFPAEGLLRALAFEPAKPIRHGASLGQSLQAIRLLSESDARVLNAALKRVIEDGSFTERIGGLWTKCERRFAEYFWTDWSQSRRPQAFMLYDPPPAIEAGTPVFIHSDAALRLIARFREGRHVAGHRFTCSEEERAAERERIWAEFRAPTTGAESKAEWDRFWSAQNGVRSLILLDELVLLPDPVRFRSYSRVLDWGYPTGVGYRYLSGWQTYALLRASGTLNEFAPNWLRSAGFDARHA